MRPFVELYTIEAGDVKGRTWTYTLKYAFAIILTIVGFFLFVPALLSIV